MLGTIARKLVPGSAKAAAKRMLGIKEGGSPFEPMSPADILADLKRYDAAQQETKDQISIALIERLTSSPASGAILFTEYFTRRNHPLIQHAQAAVLFAGGRISEARRVMNGLHAANPSELNSLLYSRTLSVNGEDGVAVLKTIKIRSILSAAELATLLFKRGDVEGANAEIATVSNQFDTDGIGYLSREIEDAILAKKRFRDSKSDNYTDSYVESLWWRYWASFNHYNRNQHADSWAADVIFNGLDSVISEHGIKTVIDFGVLCADPNWRLAKKYPGTKMIGADRQVIIKTLNDDVYELPNMEFVAGDIFETIKAKRQDPTVFFHARTAVLCYPQFIREVYKSAADAGIKYIAMLEPRSFSRDRLRFTTYDSMPDSIAFRSTMFLHNYKRLLNESGYEILSERILSVDTFLPYDPCNTGTFIVAALK